MKRQKTKFPGLFFLMRPRKDDPRKTERVYYGRYSDHQTGKRKEVLIGREIKNSLNEDGAYVELVRLKNGQKLPLKERREANRIKQEEKAKTSLEGMFKAYGEMVDPGGVQFKNKVSWGSDTGRFRNHLKPILGKIDPTEYTKVHIDKVRLSLNKKGLAPQTIKHTLGLLNRILRNHDIEIRIKMPKIDNDADDDITSEQIDSLLKTFEVTKDRQVSHMMMLMMLTGMRQGEVRKLKWKHVNLKDKTLFISKPKGGKSFEIDLSNKAIQTLKLQVSSCTIPHPELYVFPGKEPNKPLHNITKPARRIMDEAGIPRDIRPTHSLRRWFIIQAAVNGADIATLRDLVGHKSLAMTNRYVKARKKQLIEAVEKIECVLER